MTRPHGARRHQDNEGDPDDREPHNARRFSRRENAGYKWKHERTVVGALEVASEPILDLRGTMKEHKASSEEGHFRNCLRIWEEKRLRESFIEAFEGIPPQTRCCGTVMDYDAMVKFNVPDLNEVWAKSLSDKYFVEKGYRLDLFEWRWSNPTGKAETVVLMIRFHTLQPKT
jgi:hypothetical protein